MVTVMGAEGQIRWAYRPAATLRVWTIAKPNGQWTLTGTLADVDLFTMSRHPLTFVTPQGWRWPITGLQIAGVSLTAMLGPKESSDAKPVCSA